MSKKLEEQTATVRRAIAALGWEEDRFGHFKSPSGGLRVKMQKTSVRLERKVSYPATDFCAARSEWFKVTGAFIRDVVVLEDGRVAVGSKVIRRREERADGAA
jgi:hypothetical protein